MRRGWFSFSVFDGIINLRDGGKVMKVSMIGGGAPLVPYTRQSILPPQRLKNFILAAPKPPGLLERSRPSLGIGDVGKRLDLFA